MNRVKISDYHARQGFIAEFGSPNRWNCQVRRYERANLILDEIQSRTKFRPFIWGVDAGHVEIGTDPDEDFPKTLKICHAALMTGDTP